jgi:hypothetical protein
MSGWLKLHSGTTDHPKVIGLRDDRVRWAYIVVLCEAKKATPPGGWANERHFRHCVPHHYRYLDDLLDAGLLEMDDERIVVHDWDDYQADPTAADRQRRARARHRNVSRDVTVTSRLETRQDKKETRQDDRLDRDEEYVVAYFNATGRAPSALQRQKLWELYDRHSIAWLVENLVGDDPLGHAFDADTAWRREQTERVKAEEAEARREKKRRAYLDQQALMAATSPEDAA